MRRTAGDFGVTRTTDLRELPVNQLFWKQLNTLNSERLPRGCETKKRTARDKQTHGLSGNRREPSKHPPQDEMGDKELLYI